MAQHEAPQRLEGAMSKVVHLSRSAHEQAKAYCTEHGLSMSDWVASLIQQATGGSSGGKSPPKGGRAAPASPAPAVKTSHLEPPRQKAPRDAAPATSEAPPTTAPTRAPRASAWFDEGEEEASQIFSAPPFWDRERRSGPLGYEGDGATAH